MAVVQCEKAHYYDNQEYQQCPHCAELREQGNKEQDSLTVAMVQESRQIESYAAEYLNKVSKKAASSASIDQDSDKTISIFEAQGISKCIAGWLVCVQGEEYGQFFPLYAGFNRIGRSHSNDIVLKDSKVSREEHCSVVYEEKKNLFYLFLKGGNLAYLGGQTVKQAQELTHGQIITVGEAKLEFVAYCTGEKKWVKKEK